MRIDRSHKTWAIVTAGAFAVAAFAYWYLRPPSFSGPFGGTLAGLFFGGFGAAAMLYAFALNLRKLFPVWYRPPAHWWMRGHLWLGLLSYPLILFHSAFRGGGLLTFVLMWIFPAVIVTGILGAVLQHFLPRVMAETIDEGIHSQIGYLQEKLAGDAEKLAEPLRTIKDEERVGAGGGTLAIAVSASRIQELLKKYEEVIKPYLNSRGRATSRLELNYPHTSDILFDGWRKQFPEFDKIISKLERICREKRDLDRQKRMHFVLHIWLLIHVPLSILLIILGTVHAVMAFRY